jgi:hypothetical protein
MLRTYLAMTPRLPVAVAAITASFDEAFASLTRAAETPP